MAVTILSNPQMLAPVKNALTIKLNTNNQWAQAPSLGAYGLRFFDNVGPLNNDFVTFAYNNNVYTFTFKTTVNPSSPLEWIPVKPALSSYEDWIINTVAPRMTAIIGNDFTVAYAYDDDNDLDIINIVTKRIDTSLAAEITTSPFAGLSIYTIGGPFPVPRDPFVGVLRENFKVFARIYEETAPNSGVFAYNTEVEGHPDENGNVELFLNRSFVFPDSYPLDISQLDNLLVPSTRRYEMQIGEKYGTPVQYHNIISTGRFRCFNGGFSHIVFPDKDDVVADMVNAGVLFNIGPRTMVVNSKMKYWLNFLPPSTDTYELVLDVYLNDTATETLTRSLGTLVSKTNSAIGVGIPQVTFASFDDVYEYTVKIVRVSDNWESERFKFVISDIDYEFSRYFMFKNSLGMYEVVWLTGESQHKVNLQHMVAEVNVPPVYTASDAMMKKFNTSYTESREIPITNSSRFLNVDIKDIHKLYIDLCLSDDVYIIENNKLVPVIIDNKSIDMPGDAVNINTFNLSFTYAANNRAYTPSWI